MVVGFCVVTQYKNLMPCMAFKIKTKFAWIIGFTASQIKHHLIKPRDVTYQISDVITDGHMTSHSSYWLTWPRRGQSCH